jgi:eukaryotic translation initiation factor 2C
MSTNKGGGNLYDQPHAGGGGGGGGSDPPSGLPRGGSPGGYTPSGGQGGYRGGSRGEGAGPPSARASGDAVFGGPPSVDQRLTTSSALIKIIKFRYDPALPTRPDFGTLGEAGVLRVNFFAVKFPKTGVIYDYHIETSPRTDLKSIRVRLLALLEQSAHPGWREYAPFIAHDSSARLVSSKKLPQPLKVPVLFLREGQAKPTQRDKTYTISITFTQELESSALDS